MGTCVRVALSDLFFSHIGISVVLGSTSENRDRGREGKMDVELTPSELRLP